MNLVCYYCQLQIKIVSDSIDVCWAKHMESCKSRKLTQVALKDIVDEHLYLSYITAWRVWKVRLTNDGARLVSVTNSLNKWSGGQELTASCLINRSHQSPVWGCTCGIHGVQSKYLNTLNFNRVLIGQVALFGRVITCEYGWRAEKAYPLSLRGWIYGLESLPSIRPLCSLSNYILNGAVVYKSIKNMSTIFNQLASYYGLQHTYDENLIETTNATAYRLGLPIKTLLAVQQDQNITRRVLEMSDSPQQARNAWDNAYKSVQKLGEKI